MKKSFLIFLILCTILLTNNLFADYFNNRNYLIGERGAMMGGAFTALSEDVSGAYYNPAGLAFLPYQMLSINGSIYNYIFSSKYMTFTVEDGDFSEDVELEAERNGFISIPTTMGYSYTLNPYFTVAVAVFQLDNYDSSFSNSYDEKTQQFIIRGYEKLELESTTYLMGPAVGIKFSENFPLSFGISCFFHLFQGTRTERILSRDPYQEADEYIQTYTEDSDVLSLGFTPQFGLKLYITDEFQAGLMYGLETVHIYGTNTWSLSLIESGGDLETESSLKEGKSGADQRLPNRISLGLAYEREKSFTIAFDAIYYFSMDYSNPREIGNADDPDYRHYENGHIDLSLGGEIFLTKSYVLRMGFFTNTSGASSIDGDLKIHQYGGTIGLGIVKETGITMGFGFLAMGGSSDSYTEPDGLGVSRTNNSDRFSFQIIYAASAIFDTSSDDEDACDCDCD